MKKCKGCNITLSILDRDYCKKCIEKLPLHKKIVEKLKDLDKIEIN